MLPLEALSIYTAPPAARMVFSFSTSAAFPVNVQPDIVTDEPLLQTAPPYAGATPIHIYVPEETSSHFELLAVLLVNEQFFKLKFDLTVLLLMA